MIMKFLTRALLAIGGAIGMLWTAFIAIDAFIIVRAQSEVNKLEIKVDTQYKHIIRSLERIEDKLEK